MGRWHPNKPDKQPKLAVEVTVCQNAYNKIGLKAPKAAGEQHTLMVTVMPDTGASMCFVGRCVTINMGQAQHSGNN